MKGSNKGRGAALGRGIEICRRRIGAGAGAYFDGTQTIAQALRQGIDIGELRRAGGAPTIALEVCMFAGDNLIARINFDGFGAVVPAHRAEIRDGLVAFVFIAVVIAKVKQLIRPRAAAARAIGIAIFMNARERIAKYVIVARCSI